MRRFNQLSHRATDCQNLSANYQLKIFGVIKFWVQVKNSKFLLFIRPITVLNFGLMKIFCERNIEANVRDENSGKIHDYVGLSEFIQRDDPFRSRFIINVNASDTFVTNAFSETFLSRFHSKFSVIEKVLLV